MAQISFTGSFNAATLSVADLYLNVETADTGSISPAQFGFVGLVGVASWGPVNKATPIAGASDLNNFGNPTVRTADLVTHANVIMQAQLAAGIGYKLTVCRVTDTTDTAATGALGGLTLTSYHTGSLGNTTVCTLAPGSNSVTAAPTWTVTLQMGSRSEVFANIPGTTGALWTAIASAINRGQSVTRGPSQIVTAAVTTGTAPAAAAATATLSGGTDGAGNVTSAEFIGVDGTTESGIYAFRGLSMSLLVIADFCDDMHLTDLVAFGSSEGVYCQTAGASGETPTEAAAALNTAGISSQWLKRCLGDWIYWNDNYNGVQRVLAPSTFTAAGLSILQPGQSGLNKKAIAVVSTQKSRTGNTYGTTDLATLTASGIEVICKPIPAGNMFGSRIGQNTSENNSINGDNYPLMTSFLARSIAGSAAVGALIGQEMTPDFYVEGYDLMDAFLATLMGNGPQNPALIQGYSVSFSSANVTASQAEQGISAMNVQVKYLSISRIFLVNLQTGQTVVLTPSVAPAAA